MWEALQSQSQTDLSGSSSSELWNDLFAAEDAYNCLASAPFDQDTALQFLQFQSTQAYLKNPPSEYQQPPVDLFGRLANIRSQVNAGQFRNEYDFEVAVQKLILATHDAHINLGYGILSIFTFGSPYGLVSDNLMSSAASDIQYVLSTFEGSSVFYPGANISFKFENGSDTGTFPWLAQFSIFGDPENAPLITTGQELFDCDNVGFCNSTALDSSATIDTLDSADSSSSPSSTGGDSDSSLSPSVTSTDDVPATVTGWDHIAYPTDPIVAQPDLDEVNGGVLTGYVLNDGVTAILSIPSFVVNSENAVSFSTTVQDFLIKSKAAGCTRVIIDVQENTGGGDPLATDTFKQFIPSIDPFGAARMCAHDYADALGTTFTEYYETHTQEELDDPEDDFDYLSLSANVWVATDYLNAETGRNFSSWPEYFGPHAQRGDLFTTVQRDNLSTPIVTEAAAGLVVYGYANRTINTTRPFAAGDVIILSDAWCSSACARFVEMMHHEGGARTVVTGGQPVTGPMQTIGGSKGAQSYDAFSLDNDIDVAVQFNFSVQGQLPQGRDDVDFIYAYAGFNLKDSIRKGEETPLQFIYEPADCRIFYTQNTVYNYINLWNYVIDAVYRNPSLCIAGSAKPPLGPLIMKGFSQPQPEKQKRSASYRNENAVQKRSLPGPRLVRRQNKRAKPFSAVNPDALSTTKNDRPFDLEPCSKCKGTDRCFEAPQCTAGKLTTARTCASVCAIDASGPQCRDPKRRICRADAGKRTGVCISQAVNDAERDCRSGSNKKVQRTSVANPALGNFAHKPGVSRPGRGGGGR
ncbi:MAG: hypothetical protein Q9172_002798 [Xanthocarpia lactea]